MGLDFRIPRDRAIILQNTAVAGGGGFTLEYQTVYDSFTTKPSAEVAEAQNTMVESLVDAGVWTKLDVFYLLAQESNGDGEALKNWVNPGTFNATLVNAPSFVSLEGFTGNGTTSYINSNYNPSSDATNYTLNSASVLLYVRSDIDEVKVDAGVYNASTSDKILVWTRRTNLFFGVLNSVSETSAANTDSRGFFTANRTAVNQQNMYRNNSDLGGTTSHVSSAIPNGSLYVLSAHKVSPDEVVFLSTRQVSNLLIGASLNNSERQASQDAIETYMDSNGKGVIT